MVGEGKFMSFDASCRELRFGVFGVKAVSLHG